MIVATQSLAGEAALAGTCELTSATGASLTGPKPRGVLRLALLCGASLAMAFAPVSANADVTHTTSNLNLRSGPGTHHRVRAIIPSGSSIDVRACGNAWCYMHWAGHDGYVDHRYLMHHVTVEVPAIIHVTHVHKHGLFNLF